MLLLKLRNILVIVDVGSGWIKAFPVRNRISQTMKVYLSPIYERFRTLKTLVQDNDPEFVSVRLKQPC